MTQISEFQIDIETKLLRSVFLKNMAFFKRIMPEIYEHFKDFSPEKTKLTFDDNGHVNMVSDGALVYEDSPKELSIKQVDAYFCKPKHFTGNISTKGTLTYEHERKLLEINTKREAELGETITPPISHLLKRLDFIALIGVGLGYHLEELSNRTQIKHMYLWEPDKEVFYCSMHTLDFESLHRHCINNLGSLTINIGSNENRFVNEIASLIKKYGSFHLSRFYMYRHYHSEETDKGFDTLSALAYRLLNGIGFFEDEIMSISHTLTAVDKGFPLLKAPELFTNNIANKPVFVIGNGPSLDQHLKYIRDNQDNAIILTCGTALKAVLDADITPDFHIEMERQAATYGWIDDVGHKEKLKNISIIALNTVYSEIYNLFKDAFIVGKPRDGGLDFLYEYIDGEKYPGAYASNPTVSNAATAFVVRLGFKNMYLFGVDYGFKDETKHHAKGSLHNKKDYHGYKERVASAFSVKGNFCEEVLTTQTLDMSRASLELLLESSPEVNCYNCSDGAYIQLSQPTEIDNIPTFSVIKHKETHLDKLCGNAFSSEIYGDRNFTALFEDKLPVFKSIIDELSQSCADKVEDRVELTELFSDQYKYINQFKDMPDHCVYFRFINGTLSYFQVMIMSNTFYYTDPVQQKVFINWALSVFSEHLQWLYIELTEYYNKPSKY